MCLLGHAEVRRGGSPVTLPTRKALVLLAYLAVEGPQRRERLTGLLWPDADQVSGRGWNRRQVPQLCEDCHVVPRYP